MNDYSTQERKQLLKLANDSIEYGLLHHTVMQLNLTDYAKRLCEQRACFVTLTIAKQLRGCIGSLQAHQPLVQDVAHNAYAAAFQDPRFSPLTKAEFEQIAICISVLSKPERMSFVSEDDLLRQIRPNIDGLILTDGMYKGTFLPSVWESLPTPQQFLSQLKMKAGLPTNHWSDTLIVERYTTEIIE
jgi:AmmeMemoRadiSam system protein A